MIHFILNDRDVAAGCSPGSLVLDFVRNYRRLTGTKEGCKEGDCGACMAVVGDSTEEGILYKPIPSCMMLVGEPHGKHLVAIEGLNMPEFSPVQRAIVDEGAMQCGYCTPGVVVSLTGLLLGPGKGLVKYSPSVQRTLYRMGEAAWGSAGDGEDFTPKMPNEHYFLFDLSAFELENENEMFYLSKATFGGIGATVSRS